MIEKLSKATITITLFILIVSTSTANPSRLKNLIFSYTSNQRVYLSYSSGIFNESTYDINLAYNGFTIGFENRNLGEIQIIDNQKTTSGSVIVYDVSAGVGYSSKILDNFYAHISLLAEYEYYYLFSDIYVGGGIGVGFIYGNIHTFNMVEFKSYSISVEGVAYHNLQNIVVLGVGYDLSYYHQDMSLFLISRVFEHSGVRMWVLTSVMYSTTKGLIPYFEVSVGYNVLSIGYGISIHQNLGASQFWFLESKI